MAERRRGDFASFLAEPVESYIRPIVTDIALRSDAARAQAPEELSAALGERYSVDSVVGAGGMATVYLAQDHAFGRAVAVKVLHHALADSLGSERFAQEIELTARLEHSRIVPVHERGEAAGLLYFTMRYFEGGSLRQHIERKGQLPIPEAIAIARDVAQALDHAHARGVVHRDIKPANILLEQNNAFVADFGIAQLVDVAGADRLTSKGVVVGTPEYMSPEQAEPDGRLDARSDVYSLGCVLYEMLAGEPPYRANSRRDVLAKHASAAIPDVSILRSTVTPAMRRVITRALQKSPADRFATCGELVAALDGAVQAAPRARRLAALAAAVIVVAIAGIVAWGLNWDRDETLTLGPTRAVTTEAGVEMDPALSPDGKTIAYSMIAAGDSRPRIYVREVDKGNAIAVSAEDLPQARDPRWSPDGTSLMIWVPRQLLVIPRLGGPARVVQDTAASANWSPDGRSIVFTRGRRLLVKAIDGTPRILVDSASDVLHSPVWSPDGKWIAYIRGNFDYVVDGYHNRGPSTLCVVPAAGGPPIDLTDHSHFQTSPAWMSDSRSLLFISNRDGSSDIFRLRITSQGRPRGRMQRMTTDLRAAAITLAANGHSIAYTALSTDESNIWSVPFGTDTISPAGAIPVTTGWQHIEALSLSADGRTLAFDSDVGGKFDIYRMPASGGKPVPVTNLEQDAWNFYPMWSADGQWLSFHSWHGESRDVYVIRSDGSGRATPAAVSPEQDHRAAWAPDGRQLVFASMRGGRSNRLYITERTPGGSWSASPRLLTENPGFLPIWSPDGARIAYQGARGIETIAPDGSERRLLLAIPFTYGGRTYRSGNPPRWSADGKQVLFATAGSVYFLWAIPAAGGKPVPIVTLSPNDRQGMPGKFTTDGKRVFFVRSIMQADIRVATVARARRP
jgi:eukaryotic-like serine/threonine-protein kinase